MASMLNLFRNGAVGFIDWLDRKPSILTDLLLPLWGLVERNTPR